MSDIFFCSEYLLVFFYMFPVFLSLAHIHFTGFLWFPLESFSSFLKKSYYFFSCTPVGTKSSQVVRGGTVLILPSLMKDTLSGCSSGSQRSPPAREGVVPIVFLLPLLLRKCQPLVILSLLSLCPSGAAPSVSGFEPFSCDASVRPPRGCAAWETRCFVHLWLEPDNQAEEILSIL